MKKLQLGLNFLFLLLLTACVKPPIYKPTVNKVNNYNVKKTIAILPFNTERDELRFDQQQANSVLDQITSQLTLNGWEVVRAAPTSELWATGLQQLSDNGGLYDKTTGKLKVTLLYKLQNNIIEETFNQHKAANFVLDPRLIKVRAHLSSDIASWHGRQENTNNIIEDFLNTMVQLGFKSSYSGKIPASSLMVSIYSPTEVVYRHIGGIQLLGRINKLSEEFSPYENPFKSEGDRAEAVTIAISPLIENHKTIGK